MQARPCVDDTQPETAKAVEIDGSILEGGGQSNFRLLLY
jgi:hypothetical protein